MVERYIVVSDVHLGGHTNNEPYIDEFCEFLGWVKGLGPDGHTVTARCKDGKEKTIKIEPPTKIILLGDIMDLWDPEKQDRNNVIDDSIEPFSLLHDIECEKVYVTGNHDEDIEEIAEKLPSFEWKKGHRFGIYARHYPEGEKIENGVQINGLRYAFLHGHQYDKEQMTYTLSQIMKKRFDPIDFIQDLANVSFTKKISERLTYSLFALWIFLIIINYSDYSPVMQVIGLIFGIIAAAYSFKYYQSAVEVVNKRKESKWYAHIFYILFAVFTIITVAGLLDFVFGLEGLFPDLIPFFNRIDYQIPSKLFSAGYLALSYIALVSIIPKIITSFMRNFYLAVRKSRDSKIEELINENYNLHKDTLNVNVVVFGHTHMPDTYFYERPDHPKHKLFVNTGGWVKEKDDRDKKTFVYIDGAGVYLLKWLGNKKIDCISYHSSHDILRHPLEKK